MLPLVAALWLAGTPTAAESKAAVDGLLAAQRFEGAAIGIAGHLSDGVRDFRVVAHDKNAAALFAKVASEGTPAGRLYGLAGLYLTDTAAFERMKAAAVTPEAEVGTIFGCIMGKDRASTILTRIGHGDYSSEFLGVEAGGAWVEKWVTKTKPTEITDVNTSANSLVGKPGFETRFTVTVPYEKADAAGLPAASELTSLNHIEDLLTVRLQSRRTAVVALKQTGGKARRFVFYTRDTAWADAVVAQIHGEMPARTFATASESDPGWSAYKSAR